MHSWEDLKLQQEQQQLQKPSLQSPDLHTGRAQNIVSFSSAFTDVLEPFLLLKGLQPSTRGCVKRKIRGEAVVLDLSPVSPSYNTASKKER